MRVIDLFAGCGGMSLGFTNAGYNIVAAYDNWQPAIATYRRNFTHPVFHYDLSNFDETCTIFKQFSPDMVIGGPPCQDFSSAGKRDESLGRADLTISFAQIVAAIRPKWFVMENVDRAAKSNTLATAINLLKEAGYGLTKTILDASLCGVPQQRKRLFVIGELGGQDESLAFYLEKNQTPQSLTVKEFLGDLIDVSYYYRHPRSYLRRAIFSVHEPSPTIRGVNRPIPKGYPGHPGDPVALSPTLRPLTTRERSLIQTFPSDFVFVGNKAEIEQMIGNAVPVKLAEYVANCIQQFLDEGSPTHLPSQTSVQLSLFGTYNL